MYFRFFLKIPLFIGKVKNVRDWVLSLSFEMIHQKNCLFFKNKADNKSFFFGKSAW